jgi:hypothetical protein
MLIITPSVLPRQIQKFKKFNQRLTTRNFSSSQKPSFFICTFLTDGLSTFCYRHSMRKEEEGSSFGCQEKNFFPPEKKKSDGGPQKIK